VQFENSNVVTVIGLMGDLRGQRQEMMVKKAGMLRRVELEKAVDAQYNSAGCPPTSGAPPRLLFGAVDSGWCGLGVNTTPARQRREAKAGKTKNQQRNRRLEYFVEEAHPRHLRKRPS